MKKFLLFVFIAVPIISFSQKIKYSIKTRQVTVDGVFSFKMESNDCGGLVLTPCSYDVYDTAGNRVIVVNYRESHSWAERTPQNTTGKVSYYEFIFLASRTRAEIEYNFFDNDRVAKAIVRNKLIANGVLNEKAVEEFVFIYGTRFSDKANCGVNYPTVETLSTTQCLNDLPIQKNN